MKTNFKVCVAYAYQALLKNAKNVLKWKFWQWRSIKPRLSDGINRNGISEHGTLSSDSIGKKVIATKKSGFYFTIGYNKQVKW